MPKLYANTPDAKLREKDMSARFKLIFDTRGIFRRGFVEKHLNEQDYAFWKIRKRSFRASDAVIVSDTFTGLCKCDNR